MKDPQVPDGIHMYSTNCTIFVKLFDNGKVLRNTNAMALQTRVFWYHYFCKNVRTGMDKRGQGTRRQYL